MGTRHWPEDANIEVERLEQRISELEKVLREVHDDVFLYRNNELHKLIDEALNYE